jgi:hypothetical protein
MKDILQDIVAHTHSLGFLPLAKISGDNMETIIESMAEDRSVIMTAKTKNPVTEFQGTSYAFKKSGIQRKCCYTSCYTI